MAVVLAISVGWCASFCATSSAGEPSPYAPDESEYVEPAPLAERPVCPVPPEPAAEGADVAVVEQRAARIEADESCAVYADRLEGLSRRLWWIVSEQVRQHVQGVAVLEREAEADTLLARLEPIAASLAGKLETEVVAYSGGTLPVHDAAGAAAAGETTAGQAELSEAIDAGAEATRGALWYLIGAAVGCFVGYVFYRQVMPRA